MFKEVAKMYSIFIVASIVIGNTVAGNFYTAAITMVVSFVAYAAYKTYSENMPEIVAKAYPDRPEIPVTHYR